MATPETRRKVGVAAKQYHSSGSRDGGWGGTGPRVPDLTSKLSFQYCFTYEVIIVQDSPIFSTLINCGWISWQSFHWVMLRKEGRKATQSAACRLVVCLWERDTPCVGYMNYCQPHRSLLLPYRKSTHFWLFFKFVMVVGGKIFFSRPLDRKFKLKLKKKFIRQVYKAIEAIEVIIFHGVCIRSVQYTIQLIKCHSKITETRMHSSRMCTVHSLTVSSSICWGGHVCHTCPPAMHTPCHKCPHHTCHSCHACPSCHAFPPAMHAPLPCMSPLHHTRHPLDRILDTPFWKYYLAPTSLWAVKIAVSSLQSIDPIVTLKIVVNAPGCVFQ